MKFSNRKSKVANKIIVNQSSQTRPIRCWIVTAILFIAVTILLAVAASSPEPVKSQSASLPARSVVAAPPSTNHFPRDESLNPNTLADLLALTPEQLNRVDIALMNILCAEGLPGSEGLNADEILVKLQSWALRVHAETQRHLYRVADPRYAIQYKGSQAYFRASFLLQTLQEDCGVKYNPSKIHNPQFSDSRDLFLHGVMDSRYGGTCSSMPVVYAAVGRRLGYPIKLVQTLGHLFCRWDDPHGENFNIEGTNGFASFPDEFYRKWPFGLSAENMASREYLVSLTPAEELAVFLASRGHCFMDLQNFPKAVESYKEMVRFAPTFQVHRQFLPMAQLAADKGLEELERVYGKVPERIDPPPLPAEYAKPKIDIP